MRMPSGIPISLITQNKSPMIKEDEIIEIGKFQKTHALQGELNALLDVDLDFAEEDHPLIVEIDGIYVPFFIESMRPKGSESFLVKLRGVDFQEEAAKMVNKIIYAMRRDLLEYYDTGEEEIVDESDLIGYEVIDEHAGPLGHLKEINDLTQNVLLVIDTPDGQEIFVPFVDEFVKNINPDRRVLELSLPEGLVDLNKKSDE